MNHKKKTNNKDLKENKDIYEGLIKAALPNGMFLVHLYNEDEDLIIGYISGKIRRGFIKIIPGDKVKVEVSRYDCSRGRIIYRITNNRLPKKYS